MQEFGAQEAAAGIGVDFDEPRAVGPEVDVKPKEYPGRERCMASTHRRPCENARLPAGQADDAAHGRSKTGHGVQMRLRHIKRAPGKEVGTLGKPTLCNALLGGQGMHEPRPVDVVTGTASVERIDG